MWSELLQMAVADQRRDDLALVFAAVLRFGAFFAAVFFAAAFFAGFLLATPFFFDAACLFGAGFFFRLVGFALMRG